MLAVPDSQCLWLEQWMWILEFGFWESMRTISHRGYERGECGTVSVLMEESASKSSLMLTFLSDDYDYT